MEACIRFFSVRTWMIGTTMVHEIPVWLVIRMLGIPQQIERNVFFTHLDMYFYLCNIKKLWQMRMWWCCLNLLCIVFILHAAGIAHSVQWLGYGLVNWGLNPRRGKIFICSPKWPEQVQNAPSILCSGYWRLFWG